MGLEPYMGVLRYQSELRLFKGELYNSAVVESESEDDRPEKDQEEMELLYSELVLLRLLKRKSSKCRSTEEIEFRELVVGVNAVVDILHNVMVQKKITSHV